MDNLPDELIKQGTIYLEELQKELELLYLDAKKLYIETKDIPQKELAAVLKEKNPLLSGAVFNIRNGKPFERSIIKLIEPKGL